MTTTKDLAQRKSSDTELTQDRPVFVPTTDIYEQDKSILIRCDMPGVDDKNLEVTLEDRVLTLTGTQAEDRPEHYDLVLGEYNTGVYHRSFTVQQEIDHAKIKAHIQNGVLQIELPKAEQAQPKKIAIEGRK